MSLAADPMPQSTLPGLFLVVEGADGSGKSAIVGRLVRRLEQDGRCVDRLRRDDPLGPAEYTDIITAVGSLFRAASDLSTSFQVLSLAAATQYAALLESQVMDGLGQGRIVIAESWWAKTWARLGIEACRRGALPEHALPAFSEWQRNLLPDDLLPRTNSVTVLVEAGEEDRRGWYEQAGCPDPVYDPSGATTYAPREFVAFTSELAAVLRGLGRARGWPTVRNGRDRTIDEVCDDLLRAIDEHLEGV
ncbi:hypothetical protein BJF79_09635 [Actinomadura sp. CNU-125]|uniref:hypothetical protein n=1 Tax=Actinomadura sp. CNU-125 TaxID=1904961 RepID=UPI000962FAE2|nr:hypothetical protein [Actinomadura sp. CNU-125]OLT30497.1 hypothetical protein BJF79_09635 [Actinomadura sp. CNU-125]